MCTTGSIYFYFVSGSVSIFGWTNWNEWKKRSYQWAFIMIIFLFLQLFTNFEYSAIYSNNIMRRTTTNSFPYIFTHFIVWFYFFLFYFLFMCVCSCDSQTSIQQLRCGFHNEKLKNTQKFIRWNQNGWMRSHHLR